MGALTFTPDGRPGVDVALLDGHPIGTVRRCTCHGQPVWVATADHDDTRRLYRGRPAHTAGATRDQAAQALADYTS